MDYSSKNACFKILDCYQYNFTSILLLYGNYGNYGTTTFLIFSLYLERYSFVYITLYFDWLKKTFVHFNNKITPKQNNHIQPLGMYLCFLFGNKVAVIETKPWKLIIKIVIKHK